MERQSMKVSMPLCSATALNVVRLPVRFHRRNGRQMVLTHGGSNGHAAPERETNGSLVSALAKAYRWQEQLESGESVSLEDLAAANGVDRKNRALVDVSQLLRRNSLNGERHGAAPKVRRGARETR